MSCESVRQWFSNYRDGQPVPPWAKVWVWIHLRICPRCKLVQRSMQATDDALAALKEL